jgi:hypothetical protein
MDVKTTILFHVWIPFRKKGMERGAGKGLQEAIRAQVVIQLR